MTKVTFQIFGEKMECSADWYLESWIAIVNKIKLSWIKDLN